MRALLLALLLTFACEVPAVVPSGSPGTTARPTPTARATPAPQRYALLFGEIVGDKQPTEIRIVSLNTGGVRDVTRIAPKHDARFAIHPDGTRLAILDKEDHHIERTTTWRLHLLDLATLADREVIKERTDPEPIVPWDVGWTPEGKLLLASRPALERVDERNGSRALFLRFPEGTIGVTFRDLAHPTLVVSQTTDAYSVYLVDDDGVRKIADRDLVGVTSFARRPGSDEVVELVTRFDGVVTYTVLHADGGSSTYALSGPRVDGIVDLIGTTPEAAYLIWPIAQGDPAAFGVLGSALVYKVGYEARLTLVEGVRNWGEYGPLGVSPDGRALLVPAGAKAASDAPFSIAVCCERRPATPLLGVADRFVIGWLPER